MASISWCRISKSVLLLTAIQIGITQARPRPPWPAQWPNNSMPIVNNSLLTDASTKLSSEYFMTRMLTDYTTVPCSTLVPSSTANETIPATTGSIPITLETSGEPHLQPFPTSHISSPTTLLQPTTTTVLVSSAIYTPGSTAGVPAAGVTAGTSVSVISSAPRSSATASSDTNNATPTDIFRPVVAGGLPPQIGSRGDHPVPRLGISNGNKPISTNKFYANFFLGSQDQPTWTHPYSLSWSKGGGDTSSWGMSISQINSDQRVYGPPNPAIPGKPVEYFVNPLGIQSIVLSAVELGSSTALTTDTLQAFSVNVNLKPQAGASGSIVFPLLQGMGFVTAVYKDLQPLIQTGVLFDTVTAAGSPQAGVYKYQITLKDGKNWLLYAVPADGADPGFQLLSSSMLRGPIAFTGFIQIAKNPDGTVGETIYDASAGVYATAADIAGSVDNAVGTYSLTWAKAGHTANPLLMFALPHHMESFDSTTRTQSTNIQLQTTTKGIATAIMADSWLLVESNLPTDMGFAPWSPATRSAKSLSTTAQLVIQPVASSEVSQNMAEQTDLDSMYFSGKALSKFAIIVYTISKLTHDPDLATAGLLNLKDAFARFANNSQIYPLVYDTAWKGVVSTGSFVTGDPNQDFGNTYYNDHHFHYGYFIHTAAIIGSLDPDWLAANTNWVNMLVRDAGNPSDQDALFPFSRMFDWYHGHSFAKGLFESADGKDEESSSEDAFFAYAIKMWGRTTGDASMEARGNLMLSILARSLQNYFLLNSTNVNQPANFIENKATGILFENKIDHTTYFGTKLEYIEGIHMIPINPSSALTRTKDFVTEEWNTYFRDGAVDPAANVQGGWKGILYADLAIIDPAASWRFFSQSDFDSSWLDGGASRTWYLAYAAGLGGAPQ